MHEGCTRIMFPGSNLRGFWGLRIRFVLGPGPHPLAGSNRCHIKESIYDHILTSIQIYSYVYQYSNCQRVGAVPKL